MMNVYLVNKFVQNTWHTVRVYTNREAALAHLEGAKVEPWGFDRGNDRLYDYSIQEILLSEKYDPSNY